MSSKIKVKNETKCIFCDNYNNCPAIRRYSHLLTSLDKIAENNINIKATIDVKCSKFERYGREICSDSTNA